MEEPDYPSLERTASGDQTIVLGAGLPRLPEKLLLAYAQGKVLFIAGAGVSKQNPSCLPDFGKLARKVFSSLDSKIWLYLDQFDKGASAVEIIASAD